MAKQDTRERTVIKLFDPQNEASDEKECGELEVNGKNEH
jgi:hypothetical protein